MEYFDGVVIEDRIYKRSYPDNVLIGVISQRHDNLVQEHSELIKSYNEYQQALIKAGLIQLPLTPEEQIQVLIEQNNKQSLQIEKLLEALNERNRINAKRSKRNSTPVKVTPTDRRGVQVNTNDNEQI